MGSKHILVCTDLSDNSLRAVRYASEYARTNASKVTLLHVSDPQAFIPPQAMLSPGVVSTEENLKEALQKIREEELLGLDVELVVLVDHSAPRAACEYADEHDVDLIMVGSQGRSGVERWLIGSVAERIVRHANCNVFVIRQ